MFAKDHLLDTQPSGGHMYNVHEWLKYLSKTEVKSWLEVHYSRPYLSFVLLLSSQSCEVVILQDCLAKSAQPELSGQVSLWNGEKSIITNEKNVHPYKDWYKCTVCVVKSNAKQ